MQTSMAPHLHMIVFELLVFNINDYVHNYDHIIGNICMPYHSFQRQLQVYNSHKCVLY